jgi:hypothetical protein
MAKYAFPPKEGTFFKNSYFIVSFEGYFNPSLFIGRLSK